ncbi:hypothetical protein COL922a_009307 [Colletotrichum nupharicola]|nr:hypothetical protein COL922a_009307 [Colletotrichum nupharicola]
MRFAAAFGLFSLAAALPATPEGNGAAAIEARATPMARSSIYSWPATAKPMDIEFYTGAKLTIKSLDLTNVQVDCSNRADQNTEFIITDNESKEVIYSYKVKVGENCNSVSFPKGENAIMITTKMGYF